jgi:hypothetical protein
MGFSPLFAQDVAQLSPNVGHIRSSALFGSLPPATQSFTPMARDRRERASLRSKPSKKPVLLRTILRQTYVRVDVSKKRMLLELRKERG